MYVQDTPAIVWKSEELVTAPPPRAHTENKAAARRRRQMERQQQRHLALVPAAPPPPQVDEVLVLAIEQAQHDRAVALVEAWLDTITAPLTESDTCEGPKRVTQAQLTEWFKKWMKPIRSWLRNRASVPPSEIDDLAQEVFVRLLRYSEDITVDNPQGYLFKIASNVASEWRERARVRYQHDPELLDGLVMDEGEQPEALIERWSEDDRIQDAVGRLPPRQRDLLELHVWDGRTYKEAAKDRDLTYRIVLRDLTKAYSTLRSQLR